MYRHTYVYINGDAKIYRYSHTYTYRDVYVFLRNVYIYIYMMSRKKSGLIQIVQGIVDISSIDDVSRI